MPVRTDREYRFMPVMMPSEKKRFDSAFYVEGYATTFDEPYTLFEMDGIKYTEVVDKRAFEGADLSDIIMQYDHVGRVLARRSNNTLGVEPDNHGFFTYSDLSKSNAARDMYSDITEGLVTRMSYAYTVDEAEFDKPTPTERRRVIKRIKKVYDVSAVSIPANPGTEISVRSLFDGVIEREKQELLKRQRELELMKSKYFYMGVS